MGRWAAMLALLALSACATPLERCISNASADARALEVEIAERSLAVARGYRLEQRREPRFVNVPCVSGNPAMPAICTEVIEEPITRRVPINPVIEAERITALEGILAREQARAAQAIQTCEASFPPDSGRP
jgi:hypothetical protein